MYAEGDTSPFLALHRLVWQDWHRRFPLGFSMSKTKMPVIATACFEGALAFTTIVPLPPPCAP